MSSLRSPQELLHASCPAHYIGTKSVSQVACRSSDDLQTWREYTWLHGSQASWKKLVPSTQTSWTRSSEELTSFGARSMVDIQCHKWQLSNFAICSLGRFVRSLRWHAWPPTGISPACVINFCK